MSDHTSTTYTDPDLSTPGHTAHIVHVHQTRVRGLHCADCNWYAGTHIGRPGRWQEKHMRDAWQRHLDQAAAGVVITHGRAENLDEKVCWCVRCSIAWRTARATAEASA